MAYPPNYYVENDQAKLIAFMREVGMASLVTVTHDRFETTALPQLVEQRDDSIVLCGHMPRANPQSANLASQRGLAIFQGPQAYIRSNWYPTKQHDPRTTPTWDYISVRAEGTIQTFEEPCELHDHLRQLSDFHESGFADPWAITDAPQEFVSAMGRFLVGFVMRVEHLSGIWKLHQNHPRENRRGVVEGLRSVGAAGALCIAAAIERDLCKSRDD